MDAKQFLAEPRLLISADALLHNAALVRQAVGPDTRICAILKADAYGHGARLVADILAGHSANTINSPAVDALAVASIDEAELLGQATGPLLILRPVENSFLGDQRSRIETAIRSGWVLTLCSAAAADDVARIALACGKRAAVQIMIDTGMSRSGVAPEQFSNLLNTITAHAPLRLFGLGTHLAESEDADSQLTTRQIDAFLRLTGQFAAANPRVLRHVANSAGIFFHRQSHFDMVRPGISLYGIDPTMAPAKERPLRPALKWTAPLVHIRHVKKGAGVGYNQTWRATRDTRIGLIPVGYADGYLRSFSNTAQTLVCGKAAPVVGRVSMDLTTVDLELVPDACIGDQVTLLDDDPHSPTSVYQLAKWANTVPYEIFTRIGPRVHRVLSETPKEEVANAARTA